MNRVVQCILLSLIGSQFYGQPTLSKIHDFGDKNIGNFSEDIVIYHDEMIVNHSQICNYSTEYKECSNLSLINMSGDVLETIQMDSVSTSQKYQTLSQGTMGFFLSCNKPDLDQYKNVYVLQFDHTLHLKRTLKFTGPNEATFTNLGHLLKEPYIYVYGVVEDEHQGRPEIKIIKFDLSSDTLVWEKEYLLGTDILECSDLQTTPDGHLAFILQHTEPIGVDFGEGYKIIKIDTNGVIRDSKYFNDRIMHKTGLLVASDGHYYCATESNPDDYWQISVGRINKFSKDLDSLIWSVILPNQPLVDGRIYKIRDIIEAQNGDIMACGQVWDNSDSTTPGGDKTSSYNGFMIRLNTLGEVQWLRVYRNPQTILDVNTYGPYRHSRLQKMIELPSGHFIAHGEVSYKPLQLTAIDPLTTETQHYWLLIVDENGCLDNEPCEEKIYLSHQENHISNDQKLKVFPNPTLDVLNVLNDQFVSYQITDILGREICYGPFNNIINVQHLSPGLYVISFRDKKNNFFTYKFTKT